MILNVINSLKSHDPEKAYFDTNGIAGIVFYTALAATVFLYMTNHPLPAAAVLTVMFLAPLMVILFKEPLAALVEKKAEVMPKQKGMFFVQGFFELFEVLLSYFSNTLSFVRVGAFAVSHAAMMEVVLMLAGAEAGSPNWVVVILGNLFDNAIEASLALPEEGRLIRVYIDMKGSQLYISLTNLTAVGKQDKRAGRFGTTKGEGHGFGLVRIDTIVERLGGWLSRNSEDGAFTTEILLPAG